MGSKENLGGAGRSPLNLNSVYYASIIYTPNPLDLLSHCDPIISLSCFIIKYFSLEEICVILL